MRKRYGCWAAVASDEKLIIRCVAEFNSECESGTEVELRGIVVALRLTNELGCRSAYFFSDSVEAIWSLLSGFGGVEGVSETMEEGLSLVRNNPGWRFISCIQGRKWNGRLSDQEG